MVSLLLLAGCLRASAPPPSEVAPPVVPPEPDDPALLVPWMIAGDPLARRPRQPERPPAAPDLAAYVAVAAEADPTPAAFRRLEEQWPGTPTVALARGARLAAMEVAGDDADAVMDALLPFDPPDAARPRARDPLAWSGVVAPRDLLPAGERAVLLGWLADPAAPPVYVATLLDRPEWDRLVQTPAGQLVRAAGQGARDEAAAADGRDVLAEATAYAAQRAAADRPREQAEVRALKDTIGPRFGVTGDPLAAMLRRAREGLTRDGGGPGSTGLALVAIAAERLNRSCPDAPCTGFDRVTSLGDAARWGPEPAALAAAWQAIALKDARDHLDVAYAEPSFPSALDGLVEALLGPDTGPFDRSILTQAEPGPGVHLAVCRALDAGDLTSRAAMTAAVDRRLAERTEAALAALAAAPDLPHGAELRPPLERILKRARSGLAAPADGAPPR